MTMPHRRKLLAERLESRHLLSITVDTLVDELDGSIEDGDVSLRDAIAAAAQGETIEFSVTGTIELTLGQLQIAGPLSIEGPGRDQLTIDAGRNSRVLDVDNGDDLSHAEVTLAKLTVTGGLPAVPAAYDTLGPLNSSGPDTIVTLPAMEEVMADRVAMVEVSGRAGPPRFETVRSRAT